MFEIDASNLNRFVRCNGSRLLPAALSVPTENHDTTVRDEGTAAHYMIQAAREKHFTPLELVDRKAPNGVYMSAEMGEHVESYLAHLHPHGVVEQDTTLVTEKWRVNGRADYIYFDPTTHILHVYDFKYGWSIVEPIENYTLIYHAWAFAQVMGLQPVAYNFAICQPRPGHWEGPFREWQIDAVAFAGFARNIWFALTEPNSELHTGNHCRRCPALADCGAARSATMNAIDYSEHAYKDNLAAEATSFELDQIARAEAMLKARKQALEEHAMMLLALGEIVPNYSLEIGQGNRKWKDGIDAATVKIMTGIDVTKPGMVTPAEAERRGVNKMVTNSLTERPSTGKKLVRVDANRKAKHIFGNKPKG
ncbi:MAG TPA: DUF2800 domain-containing protein [Promineifilum sp.]|mgnify:CR=1 FL=1|nr:DUF2800 domain-containing protein [Promineifilum sp.]